MWPSDIAFTPTVKAIQTEKQSRHAYSRMEQGDGWDTIVTHELKQFIEQQRSVFLATVNQDGQPYIQHRGGPQGFLQVIDEHTIGMVDFDGNRQFISTGNLIDSPKAHLFLIDYQQQRRVKIWGEARMVAADPDLLARLMPSDYKARAVQVLLFTIKAWDANCPKHIPQRFEAEDVQAALAEKEARIAELEKQLAIMRAD